MSLLAPLGLLALIGLAVLILIYLLKPNYQQKVISSTYVWKLSLKYRRKRLPISRFRSILLLICQILAIITCSLIIAQPVIAAEKPEEFPEKIVILDASASMRATSDGRTRFERAVEEIKKLADTVTKDGGRVSVIYAGEQASFLVQSIDSSTIAELNEELDGLISGNVAAGEELLSCTYGDVDFESAVALAESMLVENPDAEVMLYTGTKYIDKGGITVVDVSTADEWNAAILDVRTEIVDNYYTFYIDVASYGRDLELEVTIDVNDANYDKRDITYSRLVQCSADEKATVAVVTTQVAGDEIYEYEDVYVHIDAEDSYLGDNEYRLYGGRKPTLKIQYHSSLPNNFYSGVLNALRSVLRTRWKVEVKEVRTGSPATEGYDIYIFEHTMPTSLPNDGVVILSDLNKAPEGADLVIASDQRTGDYLFTAGTSHPLMNNIDAGAISATRYQRVTEYEGYDVLMYCAGDPILLAKNEDAAKIVVMPFSLHYSNLAVLFEFPMLMYNIVNYYIPNTVTQNSFEVGATVTLNARAPMLSITGQGVNEEIKEFPATIDLKTPGTYTISQIPQSGIQVVEFLYVKVPAKHSNILREEEALPYLFIQKEPEPIDFDLLLYFAIALVSLLFIEWLLQAMEQF